MLANSWVILDLHSTSCEYKIVILKIDTILAHVIAYNKRLDNLGALWIIRNQLVPCGAVDDKGFVVAGHNPAINFVVHILAQRHTHSPHLFQDPLFASLGK